jgi:Flp pilus assembly protein CpaB
VRRRWSTASKALLALAGVSGISAFGLVRGYQADVARLRPAVGDAVPVVVAAEPIARASTIDAEELEVRQVPSAFAPPGRFGDAERVAGRTALTAIRPGEAVTATRLAPPGGAIAAVAPPGTVGVPLEVEVPARAVRPGDLVDVMATFGGHRPHTETVAEAVEVLLVLDASSVPVGPVGVASTPTLVLAATPDLAERLAYASAFATIGIAVRPAGTYDDSVTTA